MRSLIPAGTTATDLCCRPFPWLSMPVRECGGFFLITKGRGDDSLAGISVTVVRCVGRGGTMTAVAGTRTRVRAGGRRFSFSLTLLVIASFLCATGYEVASPEVLFSVREKLVRVVDSRRRVGCRRPRAPVFWCCAKDSIFARSSWKLSCLISTEAGGIG